MVQQELLLHIPFLSLPFFTQFYKLTFFCFDKSYFSCLLTLHPFLLSHLAMTNRVKRVWDPSFLSLLPPRVLHVCKGVGTRENIQISTEEKGRAQQTNGRRPLTDKSHTKTQLLITTHMLNCFIWTGLNVILLRLRFLAAYLPSAERNSVLSPVVYRNGMARRTGLPRSHTASGDKSWIFHKHAHTDILPTET